MEGRCESNCRGDEVYLATFGNEEKTRLKLDRKRNICDDRLNIYCSQLKAAILTKARDSNILHIKPAPLNRLGLFV